MAAVDYTVVSREDARAAGMKRYFTGKPCKNGHLEERIVINGYCCECSRRSCEKYRRSNPEKFEASRQATKAKRAQRREELLEIRRNKKLELNPKLAAFRADKKSRADALAAGESVYKTVRECKWGHVGLRFTKSYGCVECHALSLKPEPADVIAERIAKRALSKQRGAAKAEVVARRAEAVAAGKTQFIGSPCRHGHDGLRWVSSYACVACGKAPDQKEKKFKYDRAYRAARPEELREKARQWVQRNRPRRRSIVKAYTARRRAKEKAGDPTRIIHEWEMSAIKICHWCGVKCAKDYHVDHYVPLSKGGTHSVANLVIACPSCNLRKNARDPFEFAASVGRLF